MAPGRPHLPDATDLERWAERVDARYQLSQLIRRLIRAENDQVHRLQMRTGEGVSLPGYDGVVEAGRATPFVPGGVSVWEMGVGASPAAKADNDYAKRTQDPMGVDPALTTFVFVTPRRWPKKEDWAEAKRRDGIWRDVRALDADDIEQALDEAPSVHFRLAEQLGMPAAEVQTLEDWWDRFAAVYDPRLTPQMVLAGRANEAASTLRLLAPDVGQTLIRAPSVEDGLAFVGAVMLTAEPHASEALLSRSLVVFDGPSLRRLDSTSNLLILLPHEEELRRQADLVRNHRVVCIVTDSGTADLDLPPLAHLAIETELRAAGVPELDLPKFTRAAARSLVALRRLMSRRGVSTPSDWAAELAKHATRRAWLAGSWNARRSGDVDVLTDLTNSDHPELQAQLAVIARRPDPLFTCVGSTWAVTSQDDSWATAKLLLDDSDLEALERAAQTVLSQVDPRLDLPVANRWTAALYGRVPVHSSDLRRGIARSIALLGARGDEVLLSNGRTARLWAESMMAELWQRANQDDSAHLWGSLNDVMPLLAEAAPDVFLRAAAQGCSGETPLLRNMFQDGEDVFSAASPHTGMLWALESLAWSPIYLGYSSEILARLAEIDPGGRLSNRPVGSLVAIFRPWYPQTAASADERLRTIDAVLARHAEVGWNLLIALLPESHDIGSNTNKPEFRDWAPAAPPLVTMRDWTDFAEAVAERLLSICRSSPFRWADLAPELDRIPPNARMQAISDLRQLERDSLEPDTRYALWSSTKTLIRRHREFPDADWSLGENVLAPLDEVVERLQPPLPSMRHRWLFDDWHPDLGVSKADDLAHYDEELKAARVGAVREIFFEEGLQAIVQLCDEVAVPWALGIALAATSSDVEAGVITLLESEDEKLTQFAGAYATAREDAEPGWIIRFVDRVHKAIVQARLLLALNDLPAAWKHADALGPEVAAAYWREFLPYGRGHDFPGIAEAARRLLDNGRAAMAVDALSLYAGRKHAEVDVALVARALNEFGSVPDPEAARVSEHDIARLLDFMRESGADSAELVKLEWKYLPLLVSNGETPALEHLLVQDPSAFVSLISMVFRRASEKGEPRRTPENSREVASFAYRLLHEWHTIPGTQDDGTIDGEKLSTWVAEARRLLTEADRADVGELQIGEILARAPTDGDGLFPPGPVCYLLEMAPDDRLGRGFLVGVYNKRGVTMRGLAEGGRQEYQLAEQYDDWALNLSSTHPRTASLLQAVAEDYRAEGRRNDEDARRFLEGLDQ